MTQILVLNGGSSSIRFALFESAAQDGALDARPRAALRGKLERIGTPQARMKVEGESDSIPVPAQGAPGDFLLDWLEGRGVLGAVQAVGHRVVHGMQHSAPVRITEEFVDELKGIIPLDREHLPSEIELIELLQRRRPSLTQVACFDTAFHRRMPRAATLLPIPRRYAERGIQRYGFHGLSYTFLLEELARLGDRAASRGRVILAHLGSGASLAAVRDGIGIDTSMGFTPAAGLVMGTRSGDLDPGLMGYLAAAEPMSADEFQTMVNHESGLLGISETSADVRDLLAREQDDRRAAEALEIFCYQARKWVGAYAAALGGIDTLVFAGGIGENAAPIRARICAGLEFLGIGIDARANDQHAPCVSPAGAKVTVRVIRTDEESVIAAMTRRLVSS